MDETEIRDSNNLIEMKAMVDGHIQAYDGRVAVYMNLGKKKLIRRL